MPPRTYTRRRRRVKSVLRKQLGFGRPIRRLMRARQSPFFRESYEATVSVSHTTGDYGAGIAPYMSLFPDMSSYSGLFEQYKVMYVRVKWLPFMQSPVSLLATNATGNTGGNLISGIMQRAFDPTSNSAPTSATDLLQYSKVKVSNTFKPWTQFIFPQIFVNLDDTAYGTKPSKKQWVDMGNQSLALHGLRVYIEDIGYRHATTDLPIGKFVITVGFYCRNQL